MAAEESEMEVDLQTELNSIREEYSKLKIHLSNLEVKYQSEFNSKQQNELEEERIFNQSLRSTVASLFNNKLYSDINILMKNKETIYGHRLILSSRSSRWGGKSLDSLDILDLSDVDYRVGYDILKWVYTNNIDIIKEEKYLVDLLQLSYQYNLPSLIHRCEREILSYIDESNSLLFYDLSNLLGNKKIKNHCLQFNNVKNVGILGGNDNDENIIAIEPLETELVPDRGPPETKFIILKSATEIDKPTHETGLEISKPVTDVEKLESNTELDIRPETTLEKSKSACEKGNSNNEKEKPNLEIEKQPESVKPRRGRRRRTTTDENSNNKCKICNRSFKKASILAAHNEAHEKQLKNFPEQINHDTSKPFKFLRKKKELKTTCDICGKKFATPSSLERHKLNHTDQGPVTCPHCDREYKSLDTLSHHIRYKHSGKIREKKHTCEECGNSYISQSLLKKHKIKHTGQRPFKCSHCDKRFLEKGQKVRHEKLHTGIRSFVCESCGFAFSEKGNLEKHIASVHRREKHFACDVCQKMFFRMDTLKKHQLMHTGEKPHMCPTCNRYFAMKSNMIKHQMVHTGSKPYRCSVCDKGFTERGHVRRHMKVHDKLNLKEDKDVNGVEQVVLVVVKSEDGELETQENIVLNKNLTINESNQSLAGTPGHMVEHEGQLLNVEGHIIVHVDSEGNLVDSQGNFIASNRVMLTENQINEDVVQTDPFGGQEQIVSIKNEFIKL